MKYPFYYSTNLPMQIMEFPDYPYTGQKSYVSHHLVLKYLQEYSDHFALNPFIEFQHQLTYITRDNPQNSWLVTIQNLKTKESFSRNFDILILAPGRYYAPAWPRNVPTLGEFKGSVIHAHDYRVPEVYANQQVAVIGAGPSGIDICLEVAQFAKQVILVLRHDYALNGMPANVLLFYGEVDHFTGNSILLKTKSDGRIQEYPIDSIILATGYHYKLDYLSEESCKLKLNPSTETLDGVFRHLINIEYPSMAVLNLLQRTLPFALAHQQILYYISILLGKTQLPSKAEMRLEVEQNLKKLESLGFRPKDRHTFNTDLLEAYFRLLEKDAHLVPIEQVKIRLFRDLWKIRFENVTGYKKIDYKLISEEEYEEVKV